MKFGAGHPFADPEAAARERSLAASSPIYWPFLCDASGTASNFRTRLDQAARVRHACEVDWGKHGIGSLLRVERKTKRSPSRLLSLEPTGLELIASFSPIGWAKSIIDEHWKNDGHGGR